MPGVTAGAATWVPPSFAVSFACEGMTALARTTWANFDAVVGVTAGTADGWRAARTDAAVNACRTAAPGWVGEGAGQVPDARLTARGAPKAPDGLESAATPVPTIKPDASNTEMFL